MSTQSAVVELRPVSNPSLPAKSPTQSCWRNQQKRLQSLAVPQRHPGVVALGLLFDPDNIIPGTSFVRDEDLQFVAQVVVMPNRIGCSNWQELVKQGAIKRRGFEYQLTYSDGDKHLVLHRNGAIYKTYRPFEGIERRIYSDMGVGSQERWLVSKLRTEVKNGAVTLRPTADFRVDMNDKVTAPWSLATVDLTSSNGLVDVLLTQRQAMMAYAHRSKGAWRERLNCEVPTIRLGDEEHTKLPPLNEWMPVPYVEMSCLPAPAQLVRRYAEQELRDFTVLRNKFLDAVVNDDFRIRAPVSGTYIGKIAYHKLSRKDAAPWKGFPEKLLRDVEYHIIRDKEGQDHVLYVPPFGTLHLAHRDSKVIRKGDELGFLIPQLTVPLKGMTNNQQWDYLVTEFGKNLTLFQMCLWAERQVKTVKGTKWIAFDMVSYEYTRMGLRSNVLWDIEPAVPYFSSDHGCIPTLLIPQYKQSELSMELPHGVSAVFVDGTFIQPEPPKRPEDSQSYHPRKPR